MKRRFDIRKYVFVLAGVTALMYVLSTFIFCKAQITFVSVLLGLLLVAANAMIVYATVDFFAVGFNHAAPLVFAALALSFPSVALYDVSHWYALPVNLALYIAARFYGGEVSNDMAFFYNVLLGVAAIMFPPIAWVAVFMLIMNFFMSPDKARFIVISIVGFLLPPVCYLSYKFAASDPREIMPAVRGWLGSLVSVSVGFGATPASRVMKIVTFLVCFAVALVAFFRRNAEYSVSHSHVMIMVFSYCALIVLLLSLFCYGTLTMNTMLIMVPVSIVFYDYMVHGASDRACRIAIAFLALAILLEYAFVAVK